MVKKRSGIGPRSGTRAEVRCAWCGFVELGLGELAVHARDDQGLFEFACPSCGRVNVRPLDLADLAILARLGLRIRSGPAPFELLEPHDGPSITWDDLIEFHQALSSREGLRSTDDHHRAGPGSGPAQEREAA